jgi:hypothetical protein
MKNFAVTFALVLSLTSMANAFSSAPASPQCKSAMWELKNISEIAGKDRQILVQKQAAHQPTTNQKIIFNADENIVAHHFNQALTVCH